MISSFMLSSAPPSANARHAAGTTSVSCRANRRTSASTAWRRAPVRSTTVNAAPAQVHGPAGDPPGGGIRPVLPQLDDEVVHGIAAVPLDVAPRPRPGTDVAGQLVQRQSLLHGEFGGRDLRERECDRAVALVRDAALGRPVGPDGVPVEGFHD